MYTVQRMLANGLTVLVRQNHNVPKVSMQLWYNVGSKDEQTGERGIAHLIEHMIFKGTKQMLSESDIKAVVQKISGSSNAFTSYDYTGYMFDVPAQNWQLLLPIMADCMVNVAFKDEHLNSEMQAVIQELKLGKDNHVRSLAFDLLTVIFPDHPYHYPIIGYKQDLWSVTGKDLERFYKKHYLPNNATLVVVGDVNPDEVFAAAEQAFGAIEPNLAYERSIFYHNSDIAAKSVTLYRDIQQSTATLAYVIPGAGARYGHVTDVLGLALSGGKSSRLYKKLVDDLQLVTAISAGDLDLFDYGLFMITFIPKDVNDVPRIEQIIAQELASIAANGITDEELNTALKRAQVTEYQMLEQNQAQATMIGKYYLATGDPDYAFTYLHVPAASLHADIKAFVQQHLRQTVMHKGILLALPEAERAYWLALQQTNDSLDDQVLSLRTRTSPLEEPRYALTVTPQERYIFDFPKGTSALLSNGARLVWYDRDTIPMITIVFEFKAKTHFDPDGKDGLLAFVARMMSEGTHNYAREELAQELESRGMSLHITPGTLTLTLLKDDLEKGLELVQEVLMHATFPEAAIEKVRAQMLSEIKQFWDDPRYCIAQLRNQVVYQGHPYAKNGMGTVASLTSITRDDLVAWYKKCIVPQKTDIAVVGDLTGYNIHDMLNATLSGWQGHVLPEPVYPELVHERQEVAYPMHRDQIILSYAMPSVAYTDPDYDKLLLFDQIFGGGVLNSMTSRLFKLREETGLFYTIQGSMVAGASLQPGAVVVQTTVSLDNLKKAETAIERAMTTVVETLQEEELVDAKHALATALVNKFENNVRIAHAFLFLKRYNLPVTYFDTRAAHLAAISLQDVKDAVQRHLHVDELSVIRIGRV